MSTAIGVGVGILVVVVGLLIFAFYICYRGRESKEERLEEGLERKEVPGCFMDIPWPKQTRGEERDKRDWGEEAWVVRMKEGEKD
jgi:hypothetical protein